MHCSLASSTDIHAYTAMQNKRKFVSEASCSLDVLVVEDNVINQRVIQRYLESMGHRCTKALNGVEGLEMFTKNDSKFDIIFMDVEMPVMVSISYIILIYLIDY